MRDLTESRCAAGHSLLSSLWVSCECREPLADAAVCSLPWDAAATACRAAAPAFVIGGQQWPSDPTPARRAPPGLPPCPRRRAPLPLDPHETLPRLRHRRRPDPGQPRVRLPARHPDRGDAGLGRGGGRVLRRLPLPQPVPAAVRRGRVQLGFRAAVRQAARGRGQGGRAQVRRGGDGRPGVRDPGAHHRRRDRHAVPDVRPGARLQRQP